MQYVLIFVLGLVAGWLIRYNQPTRHYQSDTPLFEQTVGRRKAREWETMRHLQP